MEEATAGRIAPVRKARAAAPPAVNAELAAKLQSGDGLSNRARKKAATGEGAAGLLSDTRFGGLFSDPDFAIDEDAAEYKILHGGKADRPGSTRVARGALAERMAEEGESDEDAEGGESDADDDDGDADDGDDDDDDGGGDEAGEQRASGRRATPVRPAVSERRLVAIEGGLAGADVSQRARSATQPRGAGPSFEKQLAVAEAAGEIRVSGSARGSAEMTFIPLARRKQLEAKKERAAQQRDPSERRGIRELGLKSAQPKDYRRR